MKRIFLLASLLGFLFLFNAESIQAQADYKYGKKYKSKEEKEADKAEKDEKRKERALNPASLKNKLYYGGNVGFGFFNGWFLEFSPSVGYKISDEFSVGTGLVFQYSSYKYYAISTRETYRNITYGGRVFSRYKIFQGIFAHVEFEHLSFEQDTGLNDPSGIRLKRRIPGSGLNLGGGFTSGGNISFNTMALYHVPLSKNTPYFSPLIIRGGINIGF